MFIYDIFFKWPKTFKVKDLFLHNTTQDRFLRLKIFNMQKWWCIDSVLLKVWNRENFSDRKVNTVSNFHSFFQGDSKKSLPTKFWNCKKDLALEWKVYKSIKDYGWLIGLWLFFNFEAQKFCFTQFCFISQFCFTNFEPWKWSKIETTGFFHFQGSK